MSQFFETGILGLSSNEVALQLGTEAYSAEAVANAAGGTEADVDEVQAAFSSVQHDVRHHLLVGDRLLESRTPIEDIRSQVVVGIAALGRAGILMDNPAHTAARLQLHSAVAEVTRPDGNPWRAIPSLIRGASQLRTARTEPMAEATRRPVSARHLGTAALLAASCLVPGSRLDNWRRERAIAITNYH